MNGLNGQYINSRTVLQDLIFRTFDQTVRTDSHKDEVVEQLGTVQTVDGIGEYVDVYS